MRPVDSILAELDSLGYEPQYLDEYVLADRLSEAKQQRLDLALKQPSNRHTLDQPAIPMLQAIYRSRGAGRLPILTWLRDNNLVLILRESNDRELLHQGESISNPLFDIKVFLVDISSISALLKTAPSLNE